MAPNICLVFAFVFFVIAAVWDPEPYRARLIAARLAFWVLAAFVGQMVHL